MSLHPHTDNEHPAAGHPQRITDAEESRSADMRSRTIKYSISMSVRLACFIAAFFTHGPLQWILLVAAVILPYFAVIVANASGADLAKRGESSYYDDGAGSLGAIPAAAATQDGTDGGSPEGEGPRGGPEDDDAHVVLPGHWLDEDADPSSGDGATAGPAAGHPRDPGHGPQGSPPRQDP